MRTAIVGAGAIGGILAVRLKLAGNDVSIIDRGAHLDAIRSDGLRLIKPDGTEETARDIPAYASCAEAGSHDLVLLALKANVIASVAPAMRALFHHDTIVVPIQNGLPWWYFQNFSGPHAGYRLRSEDPDGIIEANIETQRIIGCVVYPAGEIVDEDHSLAVIEKIAVTLLFLDELCLDAALLRLCSTERDAVINGHQYQERAQDEDR